MTQPPRRAPFPPRPARPPEPEPFQPRPAQPRPPQARGPEPDRICGPAAVAAVFARRPQAVMRLFYVPARRLEAGPFCAQLARARKPYREVPAKELEKIAGTAHHGGIVAIAVPRVVPALPAPEALPADLLPVLDGIGNPHNLGAIARSAAFFGCQALVISGDPRQAGLSDSAWRTSEGGLEALSLYRAADLPAALAALAPRFLTVAAVARGGETPEAILRDDDPRPIALVLGNEEQGLAETTIAACARRVTLPGSGTVESLNVSVAAAVLMHALRRRGS
ncbi:TrmH family RNA methyltransferase [Roseomonas marmotae]|uniref:RNA methyltransferase n=1 Tax=Roseomonas marmotae TaxID=2768161 RepID=A0ABS3KG14_9PROT|nr:RNA methyltransferase [Roseomonas marmotae]MBO1075588.1 RNA methyltransferase [Roseomonas marmotae]QTI79450.1 RNA methyltransferase [Roseomonas marmotae]